MRLKIFLLLLMIPVEAKSDALLDTIYGFKTYETRPIVEEYVDPGEDHGLDNGEVISLDDLYLCKLCGIEFYYEDYPTETEELDY
jgi:hypothetical protein